MSLGDDIAAALPELRAQAESMMTDTCTISGPPGAPTRNPDTGKLEPLPGATLYVGRCRVRMTDLQPGAPVAGEVTFATSRVRVDVPVSSPGPFAPGCTVVIDAVSATSDPALAGARYSVVQETSKMTFATARRLACVEVSRV